MAIVRDPETRLEGDDLRLLRLSRRLDQQDVARQLGVTRQVVSAIERSPRATHKATVRYIAALEAIGQQAGRSA